MSGSRRFPISRLQRSRGEPEVGAKRVAWASVTSVQAFIGVVSRRLDRVAKYWKYKSRPVG